MNTSGGPGDKPRDVGLKAIREARVERAASKGGRVSTTAWLFGVSVVAAVVIGAWLYRGKSLDQEKAEIQAKQRAALTTLGKEWFPLRDRIEKVTVESAGAYKGDFIDPAAASWDLKNVPGLYLRLRVADAQSVESIRKKAKDSARDSFTGCFLRENNPSMAAMARDEADAGTGWNDQPWNLRLAYGTTRVLSDEWTNEMKEADDEIHLRVFAQQYEKATTEEIPHAIDIVKRAQYFLLVLDEDVEEAKAFAPDAGWNAGKITEEGLQQVVHPTRVILADLRKTSGDPIIMRLNKAGDADFRFAGPNAALQSPYVLAAMKRQVMNCNLAQQVSAALHPEPAGATEDGGK